MENAEKSAPRQRKGDYNCALLANSKLVSGGYENVHKYTEISGIQKAYTPESLGKITSNGTKAKAVGNDCLWQHIQNYRLPQETNEILLASWRNNSKGRYNSILRQWEQHCLEGKSDTTVTSINQVLSFFTHLYKKGHSYSSICLARSALSAIVKGVFNLRPPSSKYTHMGHKLSD